jgi:transposase-like protein
MRRMESDCQEGAVSPDGQISARELARALPAEEREDMEGGTTVDSGKLETHLAGKVRQAVEDVLNGLLDAEADERCGAKRYVRSPTRRDTRAGHYRRKLETRFGVVDLRIPKLRKLRLESAVVKRYRRKEASVEKALVEMYLAGVSIRRVRDITGALWGARVSPSTASELNRRIYGKLEAWRKAPIRGGHPYIFLDGIWLKRSWDGEAKKVALLVAAGVNRKGFRDILGVAEGIGEDAESWRGFLRGLRERGLDGVRLAVSDKCPGLIRALGEFFPEAAWQRCAAHFYRNVMSVVPRRKIGKAMALVKAVHAQETRAEARAKAEQAVAALKGMRLARAARLLREEASETLAYHAFPREHWRSLRTNNMLERLNREIRRRTRAVGAFPDGRSALMLAAARLRRVAAGDWGLRCYLDMKPLREPGGA